MSTFWAIRDGNALRGWGSESQSDLARIPAGKAVEVTVRQPRNAKHSALFWVLCRRIADGFGCSSEDVAFILKKRAGHVKRIETRKGIEEIPQSIAFHQMDQLEFKEFFDKCLVVITEHLGIARPDILELVKDLLEPEAVR